jgi:hypothetical protein
MRLLEKRFLFSGTPRVSFKRKLSSVCIETLFYQTPVLVTSRRLDKLGRPVTIVFVRCAAEKQWQNVVMKCTNVILTATRLATAWTVRGSNSGGGGREVWHPSRLPLGLTQLLGSLLV